MSNRGSYPHPVIDAADDVASDFEVLNIYVDSRQQDIEITYEIRTDDPDLSRLIDEGKAFHSLRWRCSSTISTGEMDPIVHKRTPSGYALKAWIDQEQVKGDVIADVRVIVGQQINDHAWKRQHADYQGACFNLKPGDILAEGGSFRFNATKRYDPLNPPIGSCFRFIRSTSLRKGVKVTYDNSDTVDVQIPAKTFDDFKLFSHRPEIQITLMVLPALMETLAFIKYEKGEEPLEDKAWFNSINKLMKDTDDENCTILEIAQKILENPIDTAVQASLIFAEDD